ncbi:flavin reductase family protein [soil metagenome]
MTNTAHTADPAESGDPSQDGRAFRRALGQYPTGVTIVTASDGSREVGVTANSFSSVSLAPPLVLWSIDRKSTSFEAFLKASHFAVNILCASQMDLSTRFSKTSDEKFKGIPWEPGNGGAPLLAGAVVHLQCKREFEYEGGDHLIMVGRVEHYARYKQEPLLFSKGRYAIAVDAAPEAIESTSSATHEAGADDEPTLLQLLLRAYEGISSKFQTHRHEEGLTLNQSRALALLARGRCESIPQIMTGALLGQSAAEDSVANLLERQLVRHADQGGYEITREGRDKSVALRRKLREIEQQVVSRTPGLDKSATGRLMALLARAAQD